MNILPLLAAFVLIALYAYLGNCLVKYIEKRMSSHPLHDLSILEADLHDITS